MVTLLILLAATLVVAILLGVLAKLPPAHLVGECAAMCGATLVFFLLVNLL